MNYKKSNGSKVLSGILTVLLVLVLAGAAALVGVLSDGFKNWDKFKPDEEQTETGGAIITEGESKGIKLMSAKIAPEDYAANGISPMAERRICLRRQSRPKTRRIKRSIGR